MAENLNPQAEGTAHESTARALAGQAEAASRQRSALFDRRTEPSSASIRDAGADNGEIIRRCAGTTIADVTLDPPRVPPETLPVISTAWRDGRAEAIRRRTSSTQERTEAELQDTTAARQDRDDSPVQTVPTVVTAVP